MSCLKLFLFLVIIISTTAYKKYNKTHYIFLDEWGTIDVKLKDGRVMYSNCTNKGSTVKNCTVVMDKTTYSNESYVCEISLKSEHARGNIGNKMKILGGLGDDKILFFWQENNKRRGRFFTYALLNMETCNFTTVKFDKRSVNRKTAVVLYDNYFDVFYNDRPACGEKMCRITYDDDGKVVNKLHSFVEGNLVDKDWILQPLISDSPDGGHFFVRIEGTNTFIKNEFTTAYYLVKKSGNQTLLKRLEGRPDVFTSVSHNVMTACALYKKNNGRVDCVQFDLESNNLSSTTISSKDNKNKKLLSVKNTIDGDILLLYKTSESNGDNYTNLTLAKFNSNGQILKSIAIKGYCGKTLGMVEDDEGNYCVVNRCIKDPDNMWGEKEIKFNYQCFNYEDLL